MPVLTRTITGSEIERACRPRHDVVVEVPADAGELTHRFTAARGPFARYERDLVGDHSQMTETITFELAPMVWKIPFGALYQRALRSPGPVGTKPWWSPPETADAQAATALGTLAFLSVVFGYIGVLLSQTISFAADEFGATTGDQGITLGAVRIGVLGALALTALADRRGRRRVLLACAIGGCAVAALSGLAPNLIALGVGQTFVRCLATAGGILVVIVAAEEVPAGSRAFAITILSAAGALGAGLCLIALPLADVGIGGWRLVMGAAALLIVPTRRVMRHLPESRRFDATHAVVGMVGHGRRLWLLAVSSFLLALFTAPASQLLNEFLRSEQGFSAKRITAFTLLTNTPGGIGLVIGGRLADTRGRRLVGAVGVAGGTVLTVAMVLLGGWPMWLLSVAGAVVGAAVVPALGVYGPELFPTSLRGRANGTIAIFGVSGGAIGLASAGVLTSRWGGLGPALALLSIGPLLMAVLVLVAYPETAHLELEELNPEDQLPSPIAPVAMPSPPRAPVD